MPVIPEKACGNHLEMLLKTYLGGIYHQGKVRDTYKLSDHPGKLLVVATDRLSIFDFVLNTLVPLKGEVLTAMVIFWLTDVFGDIPNHLVTYGTGIDNYLPEELRDNSSLQARAIIVQEYQVIPRECIVRGCLTGSGLKDYQATGMVGGHQLPKGLHDGSVLPRSIFTPSTKEDIGHDLNITAESVCEEFGPGLEHLSLTIFNRGARYCKQRGIILADTKFELGRDSDGNLILIDEVLTPDSSRFWDENDYAAAQQKQQSPSGYDKEPVRIYGKGLDTPFGLTGINRLDPGNTDHLAWIHSIDIPGGVIASTTTRYLDIFSRLVEKPLLEFQREDMGIQA